MEKILEGAKKSNFMIWNTQFSATFRGNGEFGGSSTKWKTRLESGVYMVVQSAMEDLAAKTSTESKSARESERRMEIPQLVI